MPALSSPYNFNGLVRHYFLRRGASPRRPAGQARRKDERSEQSHDIAKRVRDGSRRSQGGSAPRSRSSEVPPGPPVLQTLVAEVYGPDPARRLSSPAR